MKSLFKKLAAFFYFLWNFKTIRSFKKINNKLYKTIEDREVDRIILKGNIIKMLRGYLRVGADSEYIPEDYRNKTEIRERVLAEFGEQMEQLGVSINKELKFV